jgi:hypothetical protein
VRCLEDSVTNYYILGNKRDGLCEPRSLRSIKIAIKHLAFYSEFATGSYISDPERQRDSFRDAINQFGQDFIDSRGPRKAKRISDLPATATWPPPMSIFASCEATLANAISAYIQTKEPTVLHSALRATREAIGSLRTENSIDVSNENHMIQIRRLTEGVMTEVDASNFIHSYKVYITFCHNRLTLIRYSLFRRMQSPLLRRALLHRKQFFN